MSYKAYKVETNVLPGGKIEITLPLPAGSRVEIVVMAPEADNFADLVDAASSSMGFWDNPSDDAEWNDA